MDVDWREVRRGVSETRRFLLAHHPPDERDRCHAPRILGRRRYVCARCSGIYPGIGLGVCAQLLGLSAATSFPFVAVFPLPALLDWALTTFTNRRGSNVVRTTTGAFLGYAYGLGLVYLVRGRLASTLLVAVAYAAATAAALYAAESGDDRR